MDSRLDKMAKILVDHSTRIQPGDRVAIEATTEAEDLVRAVYTRILERGGHPHLLLDLPDQEELFFSYANDDQLHFVPELRNYAYEEFESRIKIASITNTRQLSNIDPDKQAMHQKATSPILETQMKRGAVKDFKWVSTLFPTSAFAMDANMGLHEFENFVYEACFADDATADPIGSWNNIRVEQDRIVGILTNKDKVVLKGNHVDLTLSIKGRKLINCFGENNMPDGEIFTGPIENSINGWVRYTYPAIYQGRSVEGVQLWFEDGRVVKATADKNEDFLQKMINIDSGSCYVGEFAIGTNFQIQQFIGRILFDEKIGGTFHMALGAGYPESGSRNKSLIHWDMICDMRSDAEILIDDEVIYRNGAFQI